MQYLYHPEASDAQLILSGESHRYIFKVRRHRAGDIIHLRNLEDEIIYKYMIEAIDKKEAKLSLQSQQNLVVKASNKLHIGWCVIDPKSIEKVLPSLNEMGVDKITFIYCKRSQKSFKLDFERFEKILLNSSQQSGRSTKMRLEAIQNLEQFIELYPQSKMLNFSQESFISDASIDTIVIGCEGGFHPEEVVLFSTEDIVGLDTPLVLKSESAAVAVAAHLLL